MLPSSRKRTIAVDFDGVIANYEGWGDGMPGSPRSDVVTALGDLRLEGWTIIVHSCRDSDTVRDYMQQNEIPFDLIHSASEGTSSKPVATVYWDDRAYRYSGDAAKDLDSIRNFRTWNGRG